MHSYADYVTFNKRRHGTLPLPPRFFRRQCLADPSLAPRYERERRTPATEPPLHVVIETDVDTGIVRYVIDGQRCWVSAPDEEAEANRALIEAAPDLLNATWAALGYLATPAGQRREEYDSVLAQYLRQVVDRAEGRF